VGGATPRWAVLSGNGVISDTISTTDTLGAAHIVWTLGRTPAMNALVVGFGDAADTVYATGVVGAPSSLAIIGSQTTTTASGESVVLRVVVKDRPGNVVPNATVAWTSSGGAISATTTATDSTGIATATFSANAPGTYYVTSDLPALATCIFEIVVR
jgi:adhesin/invasin